MEASGQPGLASGSTAPADYETVFTNAKAGMEGVDKELVKKVVYEMSKDSAHFQNEQRKMAQVEERIGRMREQAARLTAAELAMHTRAMDAKLAELEARRDLTRTWLHVDMDAFYAAVEELDNPQLKGKPFAVGGIGMISTASYAARKFGVRSAMPGFIGLKLCPQLLFVRPNFEKYTRISHATREIFRQYDPSFEAGSLDEAYLDVTDYCAEHGVTGSHVGEDIRRRVREGVQVTCSVGVASNRMLAKVCSDLHKPDGQYVLEASREQVMAFISTLPIRKVPGVGKVTEHTLRAFGVVACADLLEKRGLLAALFTPLSVDWFLRCGLGLGETRHGDALREGEVGRKGISCERTFRAISARPELESKVRELAGSLAEDMAREGLRGRTLTLKLKLTSFEVRTRALTLDRYVSSADDIGQAALRLLRAELPVEVRLLGLRMSNFYEQKREAGQLSLEEMLQRRQQPGAAQGQHELPAEGAAVPLAAAPGAAQPEASEVVHTSQELSQGDLVELSLRDWQQHHGSTDGGPRQHAALPAGQETAVEHGAGGNSSSQAHMQAQQVAGSQEQGQTGMSEAAATDGGGVDFVTPAAQVWACAACTFGNAKLYGRCEVCGTPRFQQQHLPKGSKSAGAKRKARQPAAGSSLTLRSFLLPGQEPPLEQEVAAAGGGPPCGPAAGEGHPPQQPGTTMQAASPSSETAHDEPCTQSPGASAQQPSAKAGPFTVQPCAVEAAQTAWDGSPGQPTSALSDWGDPCEQDLCECPRCKDWVPEGKLEEHRDWHLAHDLQRKEDRHGGLVPYDAARAGRARQGTLVQMLKKHKSG